MQQLIEDKLLILSVLVILAILVTRLTKNYGVPALLLFIGLGMLAGSEGPGGIDFNNAQFAQSIGTVALIFILFSGGLETNFESVKKGYKSAVSLATLGVVLTGLFSGLFLYYVAGYEFKYSLLIGSVIASTDAAAVFSVLRAKEMSLGGILQPVLELESGSNDPMAIFLTAMMISVITLPEKPLYEYFLIFLMQFGIGAVTGIAGGRAIAWIMNRLDFLLPGFYPVFVMAGAISIYSGTALLSGSGFLAVYLAGIVANKYEYQHKTNTTRFFEGLAWLSQIGMFITLGLLIYPSKLIEVSLIGILFAIFLTFVARPIAVFISLIFSRFNLREKFFIVWGGLRGAVPIILATFALTADIPAGDKVFNLVFFVVILSALGQGWSLPFAARFLRVTSEKTLTKKVLIDIETGRDDDKTLFDLFVQPGSPACGNKIVELGLPKEVLIVLIERKGKYVIPSGSTRISEDDLVILLADKHEIDNVAGFFKNGG
ncbi:MAG: potassium/proton antiporter [Ignavibacteriales bacterium]|nr:MAG: potassium/proton antiporter [Ignavibacteriaceae bacterium]MBW7874237.1 potassium/proton antiporter [Ignavibacteria bacterium]MCZ2142291.1 potassium/proton antiporter [Ignavibacteriales bacterium]OQY70379.1 MAG: K+/H+ antiporter [Ignavibacteriales bacterium UTCHB3]MBV6445175.1 K(+)/H(+) antiporter NhaP2 [Ignavibacteriaceae bacterium]